MPRKSRIHIPGSLHHVMARGIDGQNIFRDKKDLDHFLDRLKNLLITSDHRCYAWALMENHFHILIRSGEIPISSLMRRLLTGHAVTFNRRHNRSGHLFQNRFKSILCQEDAYFLQLIRYIHLNPLRTGTVKTIKTLNKYKYTGHAYILGELANDWQDIQYPLLWFGKQKYSSRQRYLGYIEEGIAEGRREDLTGGGLLRTAGGWKGLEELRKKGRSVLGDERMLGDSDFVEQALTQTGETVQSSRGIKENYTLDRLTEDVCQQFGVLTQDVKSASKQRHLTEAKSTICYLATRILNSKGIELAEYLNISKSAVSKLVAGFQPNQEIAALITTYTRC